jgi:hypothetical protein
MSLASEEPCANPGAAALEQRGTEKAALRTISAVLPASGDCNGSAWGEAHGMICEMVSGRDHVYP